SLSPTAPTVPPGYGLVVRVGSFLTDGSGVIRPFQQVGNLFRIELILTVNTGISLAPYHNTIGVIPKGISVEAIIIANMTTTVTGGLATFTADHAFVPLDQLFGYRARASASAGTTSNFQSAGYLITNELGQI